MNSRSVKSLALLATFCATSLFAASEASEDLTIQLPKLFIKTIHNTTPYDILLIDRLVENNSIILPAHKTTAMNFKVNTQNKVIINDNKADVGKDAQYVFIKLNQNGNPEPNQEVYFNLRMIGTNESFALIFYAGDKNRGFKMISRRINANGSELAEFEITLFMNENDIKSNIFNMNIDGTFICE